MSNTQNDVSLWTKIKNFFKKLFIKQEVLVENTKNNDDKKESIDVNDIKKEIQIKDQAKNKENDKENVFLSDLRDDYKKIEDENYIVKTVEDNPELINTLSAKRIEQLNIILDKKIEEQKQKNKRLKEQLRVKTSTV